eukprot:g11617.t1
MPKRNKDKRAPSPPRRHQMPKRNKDPRAPNGRDGDDGDGVGNGDDGAEGEELGETDTSSYQEPPSGCVGTWGPWSECGPKPEEAGVGSEYEKTAGWQTRTRVYAASTADKSDCPFKNKEEQEDLCWGCVGEWFPWSECNKKGRRYRAFDETAMVGPRRAGVGGLRTAQHGRAGDYNVDHGGTRRIHDHHFHDHYNNFDVYVEHVDVRSGSSGVQHDDVDLHDNKHDNINLVGARRAGGEPLKDAYLKADADPSEWEFTACVRVDSVEVLDDPELRELQLSGVD